MKPAYIALGSNLNDPLSQVNRALKQIRNHSQIKLKASSNWYGSKAVGPGQQPDYVNGAIEIRTSLPPETLLDEMQKIELSQGRERSVRWSARTLDLDLLWYNDECIHTPRLNIPHPRICERNFVLLPLNDLAPMLNLNGKAVEKHLESINTDGIWKL